MTMSYTSKTYPHSGTVKPWIPEKQRPAKVKKSDKAR